MRKYLLAAASALAFASPAAALDNSFYVGVEGGAMIVEDTDLDYSTATVDIPDGISYPLSAAWGHVMRPIVNRRV